MARDRLTTTQRSFVLRLWLEPQVEDAPALRCVLIEPQSGGRIGFDSLDDLADYLARLLPGETEDKATES
jgi:hypothetical protein